MSLAIETVDLWRIFKTKDRVVEALKGVNLKVEKGELFGVLGPNGAGKTTLIKILATLLLPTKGKAYVYGYDVEKDYKKIRKIINMVSGGEVSGYGLLTVRENLWMFSQFYGIPSKIARERIDELLKMVDLWDLRNAKVRTLSTGQRMKMNIVRGFMTDPKVIFLDEPTLGLDVGTSRTIRNFIKRWVREGDERTVILTTHYMHEAEQLCDRIAIINEGQIIAVDTPRGLKRLVEARTTLELEVAEMRSLGWVKELEAVRGIKEKFDDKRGVLKARLVLEDTAVEDIVNEVVRRGGRIVLLKVTEPTLEDVFLELVGRGLD